MSVFDSFVKEHEMTPQKYIDALAGIEKYIFGKLTSGNHLHALDYDKVMPITN